MVKDNVEKTQLIERLTDANERLTDTLIKLFGLEGIQGQRQSNSQASKASVCGGKDYVLSVYYEILGLVMLVVLGKWQ